MEDFFTATGGAIRHGGNQAYYSPLYDVVQVPHMEAFRDAESYYATLAHEMTHWTRHEKRLNRTLAASASAMKVTQWKN